MIRLPSESTNVISTSAEGWVSRAVEVLNAGHLVVLPTDTVYGVACPASDGAAVKRIFAVKGRPADKPLQVFVASVELMETVGHLNDGARRLAQAFLPGALTLVAAKAPDFRSEALLGGETVAIRVPGCEPALAVLRAYGRPIAMTSANRSGEPSPRTAEDARRALAGLVPLIVDGGPAAGTESTIVDISTPQPRLLRSGLIPRADIERVLGTPLVA